MSGGRAAGRWRGAVLHPAGRAPRAGRGPWGGGRLRPGGRVGRRCRPLRRRRPGSRAGEGRFGARTGPPPRKGRADRNRSPLPCGAGGPSGEGAPHLHPCPGLVGRDPGRRREHLRGHRERAPPGPGAPPPCRRGGAGRPADDTGPGPSWPGSVRRSPVRTAGRSTQRSVPASVRHRGPDRPVRRSCPPSTGRSLNRSSGALRWVDVTSAPFTMPGARHRLGSGTAAPADAGLPRAHISKKTVSPSPCRRMSKR